MKVLKKVRENFLKEPKSTKKGVFYSLGLAVLGSLTVILAPKYPLLSEFVSQNQELILTAVTVLSGAIVARYGAKEDV